MLLNLASPRNWISRPTSSRRTRAGTRKRDGTGPSPSSTRAGSHWVGKRTRIIGQGKPYLDGYVPSSSELRGRSGAIRGERAHIQFRGFSPADRDQLVQALGPKITVQESPWDCVLMVAMHHEKKPFDDKRVRRALSLALDRYQGSQALSKIAIVKEVAGIQVPGTPYATPAAELEKLAGYGRDIKKNREEAKRLLKEAGVPDGFAFTFKNRGIPMPYEPVGVWLIDQWRQIGLNVKQEVIEAASYHPLLKKGDFDVAMDFACGFIGRGSLHRALVSNSDTTR